MSYVVRPVVAVAILTIVVASGSAQAAPVAVSATLVGEMVANGQVEGTEGVVMSFCIGNPDTTPTGHLTANLELAGSPSPAQSYGSLAPKETACRTYSFIAPPGCGDYSRVLLRVSSSAGGTPDLLFFPIQRGAPGLIEGFDAVVVPALPANWTAVLAAGSVSPWRTTGATNTSSPNQAFAPSAAVVTDNRLTTPAFTLPAGASTLWFHQDINLELQFDGGVLEIAIGDGAFSDIIAAGGTFMSGGYNATISLNFGSPLAGRAAWSGILPSGTITGVRMPAAAAERSVRLRWRLGTDASITTNGGWNIDNIAVGGSSCAPVPSTVPWGLQGVANGNLVTFSWRRPTGAVPTGYLLEASVDAGLTFPFSIPIGALTSFTALAPDIPVVARVRAVLPNGTESGPSNNATVAIGSASPPGRITNLLASVDGVSLTLAWNLPPSGGTLSRVVLEAGSAPGVSNLGTLPLPPGSTGFTAPGLPAGTYFIRVRGVGPLLSGPASNEIAVSIPGVCAPPATPIQFQVIKSGSLVTLSWELPPLGTSAPSEFVLEAGNAPGAANLAIVPTSQKSLTASAPPGNYHIRVFARNSCGSSAKTADASFTIP